MSRAEFSKPTKREALHRSGGLREATGTLYGLEPGKRCNVSLAYGVEFDHVILEANSHDNSLKNCAAVCVKCHKFKTPKDTKKAAKTLRQQDKARGIKRSGRPMPGNRNSPWKQRMYGSWERRE